MKTLKFNYLLAVMASILAILSSCDTYKDDVTPTTDLKLTGKEVFVLSNGNTIIDMQSMVKTTQQVRVEITSQPAKGSLAEIQKGLVQYTPSSLAARGADGFNISIFSTKENTLLKKDTVKIIIGDKPADSPTKSLFAQGDEIYGVNGTVDIYPLKNDFIPFDSSLIRLEVLYPPYYGNAQVINNRIIRYTPGQNFSQDKMLCKIYKANDTTQFAFSSIYLSKQANENCLLALNLDEFSLSAGDAKIRFNVLSNDKTSDPTGLNLSFVGKPKYGTVSVVENNEVEYSITKSSLTGITTDVVDTLTYSVCTKCKCETSKVLITITSSSCKPVAIPDKFEIKSDSLKVASTELNILANDTGCGDKLTLNNIQLKSKPALGWISFNADGILRYELLSTSTKNKTDSLSYSICVGNRCSETASVKIKID